MGEQYVGKINNLEEYYESLFKYNPNQPRDEKGRWTSGGGGGKLRDGKETFTPTKNGKAGLSYTKEPF